MTLDLPTLQRTLRPWPWIGAAVLLTVPLVAMQFTREVQWTASDFLVMGVVLALGAALVDGGLRAARSLWHLAGHAAAAAGVVLTLWVTGAVGIYGDGDHAVNLLPLAAAGVVVLGGLLTRLRPRPMANVMLLALALHAAGVAGAAMVGIERAQILGMVALLFGVPWGFAAWALRRG